MADLRTALGPYPGVLNSSALQLAKESRDLSLGLAKSLRLINKLFQSLPHILWPFFCRIMSSRQDDVQL